MAASMISPGMVCKAEMTKTVGIATLFHIFVIRMP